MSRGLPDTVIDHDQGLMGGFQTVPLPLGSVPLELFPLNPTGGEGCERLLKSLGHALLIAVCR